MSNLSGRLTRPIAEIQTYMEMSVLPFIGLLIFCLYLLSHSSNQLCSYSQPVSHGSLYETIRHTHQLIISHLANQSATLIMRQSAIQTDSFSATEPVRQPAIPHTQSDIHRHTDTFI